LYAYITRVHNKKGTYIPTHKRFLFVGPL